MLLQIALFHSFFVWLNNIPLYYFFVHSSVYGHLSCFHVASSAALNIGVHVSFPIRVIIFCGYVPHG